MSVDLCIVNFNTSEKLLRLLETVHSDAPDTDIPWRMYIADNGSTDDSVKALGDRWLGHKGNFVLVKNENIGYSAACNQLASYGNGDIIGLLNADIWFTTADVKRIQEIFDKDPSIFILGPKQTDEKGLIRHGGIVGTNTAPRHRGWNEYDPSDRSYKDRIDCVTVSGSAYFIRRSVWNALRDCTIYKQAFPEATGAFLPTPHFYEETWCSYHATAHGYRVVYDGSVSIGHSWHASSAVGSQNDNFKTSSQIFKKMCELHGIEHDIK